MGKNIFFTSDLHLNHENIIKYCNRPFSNKEEMNKTIINNWNKTVSNNDDVYILGDYVWGGINQTDILKKITGELNGNKILIRGNHDRYSNYDYINAGIREIYDIWKGNFYLKNEDFYFVLCHYAMRFWDRSHLGSYCLFGHEHFKRGIDFDAFKKLEMSTRTLNVCSDGNKFCPYSLDEILQNIKDNPINFISR